MPSAGPFQDQRLPFFAMYAKQWFLLAVARIALNHPREIARHRRRLDRSLWTQVPHVGLREPARRALIAASKAGRPNHRSDGEEAGKLTRVGLATRQTAHRHVGTMSWDRPKKAKEPKPPFHFASVSTSKIWHGWATSSSTDLEGGRSVHFGGSENGIRRSNPCTISVEGNVQVATLSTRWGRRKVFSHMARTSPDMPRIGGRSASLTNPVTVGRYTFDSWEACVGSLFADATRWVVAR